MNKFWGYLMTHKRYVAFVLMLSGVLTEQSSRVAISLAMIGGMIKKDCTDPNDTGEICMSEEMKVLLLGAYFYGYALQIIPTTVARRTSFTIMLKISFFVGGLVQLVMPIILKLSVPLAVVLQACRGLLAGVIVPNNMEFARKWSFGRETKVYISIVGSISLIGIGLGPMVAGFITTRFGWKSFFYVSGSSYILMSILLCLIIREDPLDSFLIRGKERELFVCRIKAHQSTKEANENKEKECKSLKEILKRVYPYSFCVFMFFNAFQFYSIMTLTPFYLDEVLKAPTDLISVVQAILGITSALSTQIFTLILIRLDKILPWLQCRTLITSVALTLRSIGFIVMALSPNLTLAIMSAAVCISTAGVMYSGSLITINYELDPINSGVILAIFNSFGQTSGFISPLVNSRVVSATVGTPDYESTIRQQWANYYFIAAAMTLTSFFAIILAYLIRKSEWKKHESLLIDENKKSFKVHKEDEKYVVANPEAAEDK